MLHTDLSDKPGKDHRNARLIAMWRAVGKWLENAEKLVA